MQDNNWKKDLFYFLEESKENWLFFTEHLRLYINDIFEKDGVDKIIRKGRLRIDKRTSFDENEELQHDYNFGCFWCSSDSKEHEGLEQYLFPVCVKGGVYSTGINDGQTSIYLSNSKQLYIDIEKIFNECVRLRNLEKFQNAR